MNGGHHDTPRNFNLAGVYNQEHPARKPPGRYGKARIRRARAVTLAPPRALVA